MSVPTATVEIGRDRGGVTGLKRVERDFRCPSPPKIIVFERDRKTVKLTIMPFVKLGIEHLLCRVMSKICVYGTSNPKCISRDTDFCSGASDVSTGFSGDYNAC